MRLLLVFYIVVAKCWPCLFFLRQKNGWIAKKCMEILFWQCHMIHCILFSLRNSLPFTSKSVGNVVVSLIPFWSDKWNLSSVSVKCVQMRLFHYICCCCLIFVFDLLLQLHIQISFVYFTARAKFNHCTVCALDWIRNLQFVLTKMIRIERPIFLRGEKGSFYLFYSLTLCLRFSDLNNLCLSTTLFFFFFCIWRRAQTFML